MASFKKMVLRAFGSKQSLALGVVVLVVVLAVGFVYGRSFADDVRGGLALRGAHSIEADSGTRVLNEFGLFGTKHVSVPFSGTIVDYAEGGATKVALIVSTKDGKEDFALLSTSRMITSDGGIKGAPAVSSDGSMLAYARFSKTLKPDDNVGAALAASSVDDWIVETMDIAKGAVVTHGAGYAPQFFTIDGARYLFFTTSKGLTMLNLGNRALASVALGTTTPVRFPAKVSADGGYVALLDAATYRYSIFSLRQNGSIFSIQPKGELPLGTYLVAFKGSSVFGVARAGSGPVVLSVFDLKNLQRPILTHQFSSTALYRFIP
ncbi:MAG: hypothetical protein V4437_02180 [Patescibacteria group bacterium]